MNRFLFITLAVYCLMQLALAVIDSESNQDNIDFEKTNPNTPMSSEKPVCISTNPESVLKNVNYFSEVIGEVEFYDIDSGPIDNLQSSIVESRPELIGPVQIFIKVSNAFKDVINLAVDKATEKLQLMTDQIDSDIEITEFVENKLKDITADQVKESCEIIELLDRDVKTFNATIEKYKENYTKAVSPNLDEIMEGIKNLSIKYSKGEPDLETTHQKIGKLITMIETETENINTNAEKNLKDFYKQLKAEGTKCEWFIAEYYKKFQKIFQKPDAVATTTVVTTVPAIN